jgi:hypothetical protein
MQIIPISKSFLQKIRNTGVDDLGQAVEKHIAKGGEPCRDVLRRAVPGEKLLLASYCPFTINGPYKEYGPVFVLAEETSEEIDLSHFPTGADAAYFGECFVLRAYSHDERIVDAKLSAPQMAKSDIADFLDRPDVAFILARFPSYGCYGCRIEAAQ